MPGNGLGLSLVATVARLHGASIRLVDNAPGLRVELRFPFIDSISEMTYRRLAASAVWMAAAVERATSRTCSAAVNINT